MFWDDLHLYDTQYELVEPVLPQAAQLGIRVYCFDNTQVVRIHLEGPNLGHSTSEGKLEKIERRRRRRKAQLPGGVEPMSTRL